jgi:hypothetical protein
LERELRLMKGFKGVNEEMVESNNEDALDVSW